MVATFMNPTIVDLYYSKTESRSRATLHCNTPYSLGVNVIDIATDTVTSIRWKGTCSDVTKDELTWDLDS